MVCVSVSFTRSFTGPVHTVCDKRALRSHQAATQHFMLPTAAKLPPIKGSYAPLVDESAAEATGRPVALFEERSQGHLLGVGTNAEITAQCTSALQRANLDVPSFLPAMQGYAHGYLLSAARSEVELDKLAMRIARTDPKRTAAARFGDALGEQIHDPEVMMRRSGADDLILHYNAHSLSGRDSKGKSLARVAPPIDNEVMRLRDSAYAACPGLHFIPPKAQMMLLLAASPLDADHIIAMMSPVKSLVLDETGTNVIGARAGSQDDESCDEVPFVRPLAVESWHAGAAVWVQTLLRRSEDALRKQVRDRRVEPATILCGDALLPPACPSSPSLRWCPASSCLPVLIVTCAHAAAQLDSLLRRLRDGLSSGVAEHAHADSRPAPCAQPPM